VYPSSIDGAVFSIYRVSDNYNSNDAVHWLFDSAESRVRLPSPRPTPGYSTDLYAAARTPGAIRDDT